MNTMAPLMGILIPVLATLAAFAVGAILIFAIGINPLAAYGSLLEGAFGSVQGIAEVFVKATPLALTGLAVAIAFKCGFWNIGAEGQFYMGALAAAWMGLNLGGIGPLLLPVIVAASFSLGAIWAGIAGVLKTKFGSNEIFVTLMLNFVAIYIISYLVYFPMREPGGILPKTDIISPSAWLLRLIPGTRFHAGIFVALLSTVLLYLILRKTILGYRVRTIGANPVVARYGGIDVSRTVMLVVLISGGLAGLAGMGEVCGVHRRLAEEISLFPLGYGFLGIWVALMGKLEPLGALLSSLFFAVMFVGGETMQRGAGVPAGLVFVILGLVVLFVVGTEFLVRRRR